MLQTRRIYMNTLEDKKKLEEQLNQTLGLSKLLRDGINQVRTISFIAIYIGVIATIILIKVIFW